jgi:hypothetical protein
MQIIPEFINSHGSGKFYDFLWGTQNKLLSLPQSKQWNANAKLCRVNYVLLWVQKHSKFYLFIMEKIVSNFDAFIMSFMFVYININLNTPEKVIIFQSNII